MGKDKTKYKTTHTRSAAKQAEHAERYSPYRRKAEKQWDKGTVDYVAPLFENEFNTGRMNSARVTGRFAVHPSTLKTNDKRTRVRVRNPYNVDGGNPSGGPRLLFTRFPKVVKQKVAAEMGRRIALMRLKIPVRRRKDGLPNFGRDANRKGINQGPKPKCPTKHHGTWQPRSKRPRITAEWNRLSLPAKKALNDALEFGGRHIFDRLDKIVRREYPEIVETMMIVRCWVLHHSDIRKTFDEWPGLNLGPMFNTIAITDRGSKRSHVDWLDHKQIPAIVVPLGNFGQSCICFPQLHKKFAIRSGDAFGAASRILSHYAQVLGGGQRDCLTLFTHNSLVVAAQRWWKTLTDREKAWRLRLAKKYDVRKYRSEVLKVRSKGGAKKGGSKKR
ncbi:hypothetical protein K474DRAFT_1680103 [Panus rudis PR-1116 ss-1]|nr:hypothetical protein K474DRAFT_1680103 [Panus rudis PR-1116 ss-1]